MANRKGKRRRALKNNRIVIIGEIILALFILMGVFLADGAENKRAGSDLIDERIQEIANERMMLDAGKRHFITFIDDDGYNTFYEYLLPIVKEKGISISTAIELDNVGTGNFMTWETIAECHASGAEILNHTKEHIVSREEIEKFTGEEILASFKESKKILSEHGYHDTCDILIYSGDTAAVTWPYAQQVFRCGINAGGNEVNVEPFNLFTMRRYRVGSDHVPTFEELKGYIDEVTKVHGWEIWMMHSENGYMTPEYLEAFRQAIDYCGTVGVEIVSAKEALDYFGIPENKTL